MDLVCRHGRGGVVGQRLRIGRSAIGEAPQSRVGRGARVDFVHPLQHLQVGRAHLLAHQFHGLVNGLLPVFGGQSRHAFGLAHERGDEFVLHDGRRQEGFHLVPCALQDEARRQEALGSGLALALQRLQDARAHLRQARQVRVHVRRLAQVLRLRQQVHVANLHAPLLAEAVEGVFEGHSRQRAFQRPAQRGRTHALRGREGGCVQPRQLRQAAARQGIALVALGRRVGCEFTLKRGLLRTAEELREGGAFGRQAHPVGREGVAPGVKRTGGGGGRSRVAQDQGCEQRRGGGLAAVEHQTHAVKAFEASWMAARTRG